jgi:hypothetical protein
MPDKPKKHEVQLEIASPLSFLNPADLRNAVTQFCAELPELLPTKWGFWEPLGHDFDLTRPMDWTPVDGPPIPASGIILERRSKPKTHFSVSPRMVVTIGDTHGSICCYTYLGEVNQQRLTDYLRAASKTFRADFAYLNKQPNAGEIDPAKHPSYHATRFPIVTHDLRKFLPEMLWATIFGAPYVKLFGLERLLSAPAFKVEQMGPEMVYVQLTERLDDAVNDFANLQAARDAFKAHFKSMNVFFDPALPSEHQYTTPAFHLDDSPDLRYAHLPKPQQLLAEMEKRLSSGLIATSEDLSEVTRKINSVIEHQLYYSTEEPAHDIPYSEQLIELLEKIRLYSLSKGIAPSEEAAEILNQFR